MEYLLFRRLVSGELPSSLVSFLAQNLVSAVGMLLLLHTNTELKTSSILPSGRIEQPPPDPAIKRLKLEKHRGFAVDQCRWIMNVENCIAGSNGRNLMRMSFECPGKQSVKNNVLFWLACHVAGDEPPQHLSGIIT